MKKYVFIIFMTFLFFLSSTNIDASTVANFEEVSSGRVNAELVFEDGFVGGVDVKLRVSGNVSLKEVVWDSGLSSKYTKRFSYKNGVINLIITTGKNTNNLVDKDGLLKLGTLVFSGSDDYVISLSSVTIVDAKYNSKDLTSLSTDQDNHFNIQNTSSSSGSEDETQTNPDSGNTSSGTGSSSNVGNSSSSVIDSNDNANGSVNDSEETSKDTVNEELKEEDNTSEEKEKIDSNKDKKTRNVVSEEDGGIPEKETRIFFIVTFVLIGLIILAAVLYARKCNRLKN